MSHERGAAARLLLGALPRLLPPRLDPLRRLLHVLRRVAALRGHMDTERWRCTACLRRRAVGSGAGRRAGRDRGEIAPRACACLRSTGGGRACGSTGWRPACGRAPRRTARSGEIAARCAAGRAGGLLRGGGAISTCEIGAVPRVGHLYSGLGSRSTNLSEDQPSSACARPGRRGETRRAFRRCGEMRRDAARFRRGVARREKI